MGAWTLGTGSSPDARRGRVAAVWPNQGAGVRGLAPQRSSPHRGSDQPQSALNAASEFGLLVMTLSIDRAALK